MTTDRNGHRVQPVESFEEIRGLRAEGAAHWQVVAGSEGGPELREMVMRFAATLNGNVSYGPEAVQWAAIRGRLEAGGPTIWVELVPPVGVSTGTESHMGPTVDTYINRLHISKERPRSGFG